MEQTTHTLTLASLIAERLGLDVTLRANVPLPHVLPSTLEQLRDLPTDAPQWQALIAPLTLGETYFFRHRPQFQTLRDVWLPTMLQRYPHGQRLRVWCVGCSSGEEAYSLVLAIQPLLPSGYTLELIATDLNSLAIKAANRAVYREWAFRGEEPPNLRGWAFVRDPDGYRLRDDLRGHVRFRQGNLLESPAPQGLHLILCRNVLLYFTPRALQRAELILQAALVAGGWLMLGQAEALKGERVGWQMHVLGGRFVYEKAAELRLPVVQAHHPESLPSPTPEAVIPYQQALAAYQRRAWQEAEAHLIRNPSLAARVLLAAVQANRGDTQAAHTQIAAVLQAAPLYADAHVLQALLYLEGNATPLVARALKAALYSQPGHPLAAFLLGNLHAQRGEHRRAHILWEQALEGVQLLPAASYPWDISLYSAGEWVMMIRSALTEAG